MEPVGREEGGQEDDEGDARQDDGGLERPRRVIPVADHCSNTLMAKANLEYEKTLKNGNFNIRFNQISVENLFQPLRFTHKGLRRPIFRKGRYSFLAFCCVCDLNFKPETKLYLLIQCLWCTIPLSLHAFCTS